MLKRISHLLVEQHPPGKGLLSLHSIIPPMHHESCSRELENFLDPVIGGVPRSAREKEERGEEGLSNELVLQPHNYLQYYAIVFPIKLTVQSYYNSADVRQSY